MPKESCLLLRPHLEPRTIISELPAVGGSKVLLHCTMWINAVPIRGHVGRCGWEKEANGKLERSGLEKALGLAKRTSAAGGAGPLIKPKWADPIAKPARYSLPAIRPATQNSMLFS